MRYFTLKRNLKLLIKSLPAILWGSYSLIVFVETSKYVYGNGFMEFEQCC